MPSSNSSYIDNINENTWQGNGGIKGHYRLVLMGAAKVGKTAIVHQFLYDQFSSEYRPTVEELYRGEYDFGSIGLTLDLLDTSGTYEFPAMRKLAVNTGDAFVLVYSIDDAESFEEVRRLKSMLLENKSQNVPVVIVGNKCDMEKNREVKKELAEMLVSVDWENTFLEVSAKDSINVVQVFKEILQQAKFPYDLNPAVQRRRTSLPHCFQPKLSNASSVIMHKNQKQKQKRNSCAVS